MASARNEAGDANWREYGIFQVTNTKQIKLSSEVYTEGHNDWQMDDYINE